MKVSINPILQPVEIHLETEQDVKNFLIITAGFRGFVNILSHAERAEALKFADSLSHMVTEMSNIHTIVQKNINRGDTNV